MQRNRFMDFLDVIYQMQMQIFASPSFPNPQAIMMQGQSLYVGLNGSHPGHQGLSASKILHAVVCYHEATLGSGMWQW